MGAGYSARAEQLGELVHAQRVALAVLVGLDSLPAQNQTKTKLFITSRKDRTLSWWLERLAND
jgi:hypothetical protein